MAGAGVARDLAQRGSRASSSRRSTSQRGRPLARPSSSTAGSGISSSSTSGWSGNPARARDLARLASHLIRPLPFLMPVYRAGRAASIKVRLGLRLYDLLTPGKRTPRYGVVDAARARTLEPTLRPEGLLGAGYYFDDLLLSPERLCLENVLSAGRARTRSTTSRRRSSGGVPTVAGRRGSGPRRRRRRGAPRAGARQRRRPLGRPGPGAGGRRGPRGADPPDHQGRPRSSPASPSARSTSPRPTTGWSS